MVPWEAFSTFTSCCIFCYAFLGSSLPTTFWLQRLGRGRRCGLLQLFPSMRLFFYMVMLAKSKHWHELHTYGWLWLSSSSRKTLLLWLKHTAMPKPGSRWSIVCTCANSIPCTSLGTFNIENLKVNNLSRRSVKLGKTFRGSSICSLYQRVLF